MKKYDYNPDVLNHWSPGLAYVLGLALTDGSVNRDLTRISFYSTDQQMLEIIRTFFQSTRPIFAHSRPGKYLDNGSFPGKKQMYAFYVDSKRIVERFCQFGITPNKSYVGPYPIIPRDIWWHYFRGILDGDGNILFSRKVGLRISIAGNRNCILGLRSDLLEFFSIHSQAAYLNEDKCKYLYLYGENAEKSLTLTYQESENLRLERKYNQWFEWNQHIKLMTICLLCENPLRASKGEKLCPTCRVIRQRLMNRRSDHYRRKGVWLSLRELCKPEESLLPVERLDRYITGIEGNTEP
jgi:hypothetical protein